MIFLLDDNDGFSKSLCVSTPHTFVSTFVRTYVFSRICVYGTAVVFLIEETCILFALFFYLFCLWYNTFCSSFAFPLRFKPFWFGPQIFSFAMITDVCSTCVFVCMYAQYLMLIRGRYLIVIWDFSRRSFLEWASRTIIKSIRFSGTITICQYISDFSQILYLWDKHQ